MVAHKNEVLIIGQICYQEKDEYNLYKNNNKYDKKCIIS